LTHEEVEHAASRLQRRFLRKTQVFLRVSKETISRITDKVIEEMNDWAVRPLDEIYAAIFIDAIVVKVRDGQVGNRPFYEATSASTSRWTSSSIKGRRVSTKSHPENVH
jgi:transposase-like protein